MKWRETDARCLMGRTLHSTIERRLGTRQTVDRDACLPANTEGIFFSTVYMLSNAMQITCTIEIGFSISSNQESNMEDAASCVLKYRTSEESFLHDQTELI